MQHSWDGARLSGSIEVDAANIWTTIYGASASTCVPITGDAPLDIGFSAKLVTGPEDVGCSVEVGYHHDPACASLPTVSASVGLSIDINTSWDFVFRAGSSPHDADAHFRMFRMTCNSSSGDFVVRFDDALYGEDLVPVTP